MNRVCLETSSEIDLFRRIELVDNNDRLMPSYLIEEKPVYRVSIPIDNDKIQYINLFLTGKEIKQVNDKFKYAKKCSSIINIHFSNKVSRKENYMFKSSCFANKNPLIHLFRKYYLHIDIKLVPITKNRKIDNILVDTILSYQFLFFKYKPKSMQPKLYKVYPYIWDDLEYQLKMIV